MTTHHPRRHPIILVTGTPGTGKTLHASVLTAESDGELVHLNVGDIVKLHGLHEGWDDEWQSYTVDEDRLLDHLEEIVNPSSGPAETGFIIDHHDPGLFPERWIDLAVVLTCDNKVLYERLEARNYPQNKITENITAEIMMTCVNETRENYDENIVVELHSDGSGGENEVEDNVHRIAQWVTQWTKDREEGVHDAYP